MKVRLFGSVVIYASGDGFFSKALAQWNCGIDDFKICDQQRLVGSYDEVACGGASSVCSSG